MNPPHLEFDQQIEVFLATCRTATLATVDDEGRPHAANVQVVHDAGWGLSWISSPRSAHSRYLAARPAAAVTLYSHLDEPELIHGLQLHGQVRPAVDLDDSDWPQLWARYTAKYPFVASAPRMRAAAEGQRFYTFVPSWLRWIDNRRGFGFKIEKTLDKKS